MFSNRFSPSLNETVKRFNHIQSLATRPDQRTSPRVERGRSAETFVSPRGRDGRHLELKAEYGPDGSARMESSFSGLFSGSRDRVTLSADGSEVEHCRKERLFFKGVFAKPKCVVHKLDADARVLFNQRPL